MFAYIVDVNMQCLPLSRMGPLTMDSSGGLHFLMFHILSALSLS